MREILFRGKLLNGGEWSFGCLKIEPDRTIALITPDDTLIGKYGRIDPLTVGQFTGLCDANGVKIFEGDLVGTDYGDIGKIKWVESVCAFVIDLPDDWAWIDQWKRLEVVGNVYDNPELIGGIM